GLPRRRFSERRDRRRAHPDAAAFYPDDRGRRRPGLRSVASPYTSSIRMGPELSVVIPVYNEQAGLPALFARLYPALDALGRSYELILIDDGSRDRTLEVLRAQFERRPDVTRVVVLAANFGQHMAIMAGFKHARG